MQRLISPYPPKTRAVAVSKSAPDQAISRLIKYIPTEIISGYMLLSGIVDAASQSSNLRIPAAWLFFILGLMLTPLYLWKTGKPEGVQWWHLVISTASFALWAYALGGPFRMGPAWIEGYPYESWFAAALAGGFTWAVALAWKPRE
jgi:hypothetical protein